MDAEVNTLAFFCLLFLVAYGIASIWEDMGRYNKVRRLERDNRRLREENDQLRFMLRRLEEVQPQSSGLPRPYRIRLDGDDDCVLVEEDRPTGS